MAVVELLGTPWLMEIANLSCVLPGQVEKGQETTKGSVTREPNDRKEKESADTGKVVSFIE